MLSVPIFICNHELGRIEIGRLEPLSDTKDRYQYHVRFYSKEWRSGTVVETKPFYSYYSEGVLVLMRKAIAQLIKEFPELKAARFGKPRNRAKCRKCGDIIWSRDRHHYVRCKCGAISLDGGYDYIRRTGAPRDFIPVEDS